MSISEDSIGFIQVAATDPELIDSSFCEALTGEQRLWVKACFQAVAEQNEPWLEQYWPQEAERPFPLGSDDPLANTNQHYPALAQRIALVARAALRWKQWELSLSRPESPPSDPGMLVQSVYHALRCWQQSHLQDAPVHTLLAPPEPLGKHMAALLQESQPTAAHLRALVHAIHHQHPEWQLAAPAHLLASFHTTLAQQPYRIVSIVVPLDLGTLGVIATLELESFRHGIGQLYADPLSMAFFDQSNSDFQDAVATAWQYAATHFAIQEINVCWRIKAHSNIHYHSTYLATLEGNSIGAGLTLGLLHLLDPQRRLIRLDRLRWAITGAVRMADDGTMQVCSVSGYERKLDAALQERLQVLVPTDDLPGLSDTWAQRLPVLEGVSTVEQAAERITTPGVPFVGATALPATPPRPVSLPYAPVCVGRATIREVLRQHLEQTHIIAIIGVAGIGKTVLATTMAHERVPFDRIFWYRFRATDSLEMLLRTLAWFFGWHGDEALWQQLSYYQPAGEEPVPEWCRSLIRQVLCGQHYVLCFDDIHELVHDPRSRAFVQELITMCQACAFELILIGRHTCDLTLPGDYPALTGLSVQETALLFAHYQTAIAPETLKLLHLQLQGNPYYFVLTIQALQHTTTPQTLLEHLLSFGDTATYLNTQLAASLSPLERHILHVVAVLLGYPADAATITTLLHDAPFPRDAVQTALDALVNRSLLLRNDQNVAPQYEQHDLLRAFYYTESLSLFERRQLHMRVAYFYLESAAERDDFRSALHFQRAGLLAEATQWYTADLRTLTSKGQIGLLQGYLDDLDDQIREMQVRVALGRGEMLRYRSQHQALEHLKQGVQLLATGDGRDTQTLRVLKARVYLTLGGILSETDQYEPARQYLETCLHLLTEPNGDPLADTLLDVKADALLNLANVLCETGDPQVGISYYQQALDIYEQGQNMDGMLAAWHNLSIEREFSGDWSGAVSEYLRLIELTEHVGYRVKYIQFALSLSIILINRANHDALRYLHQAIELARQYHMFPDLIAAFIAAADWYVRQTDQRDMATKYLVEADMVIHQYGVDVGDQQAELYRLWAEVYLGDDHLQMAEHYAHKACTSAQEHLSDYIASRCLRTLGRVFCKQTAYTPALDVLQRSLDFFQTRDQYEAARTQLELGQVLLATNQVEAGKAMLRAAYAVFQRVGAREMPAVEQLLLHT